MSKSLAPILLGFGLLASTPMLASERTVILAVQNMHCANCPFVVKRSLETVPGVVRVTVSYNDKTATVTYDDEKAGLNALTAATTNSGYPSGPKS